MIILKMLNNSSSIFGNYAGLCQGLVSPFKIFILLLPPITWWTKSKTACYSSSEDSIRGTIVVGLRSQSTVSSRCRCCVCLASSLSASQNQQLDEGIFLYLHRYTSIHPFPVSVCVMWWLTCPRFRLSQSRMSGIRRISA